ncbi:extracellular solute-binding protein [Zhengella sp. ZM62]|uniref:extracellular solute-binding protein n=1 Tax=Zhengella sedimenti TaxID=3390035 RepID=UPI003976B29A
MDVQYDVFPEDVYFDKVTAALSSGSTEYDAFMSGAYMTWIYGPASWIEDLNQWIKDDSKTNPDYNWGDMLPGVVKSCAWNGKPGGALGSDDAKQWCIPLAYEQNNLTYNKRVFDSAGIAVPTNLDELLEAAAKGKAAMNGGYGVGVRPYAVRRSGEGPAARVLTNQWLGDQRHIAAAFANGTLVLVEHDRANVDIGAEIRVALDPADLHVFDPGSGKAIAHGAELAG